MGLQNWRGRVILWPATFVLTALPVFFPTMLLDLLNGLAHVLAREVSTLNRNK
jgi:hypothetical protein